MSESFLICQTYLQWKVQQAYVIRWYTYSNDWFPQLCDNVKKYNEVSITSNLTTWAAMAPMSTWASCQIRKIASCACAENAGNVSPQARVSDPDMHHGACVTHVPWWMSGSLNSGFLWGQGGQNVPGIPGTCAMRNFTYLVRDSWYDIIVPPQWWRHAMETLSALLALCEGQPMGQQCGASVFLYSLNRLLNKQWVADDIGIPWRPCDLTVMLKMRSLSTSSAD